MYAIAAAPLVFSTHFVVEMMSLALMRATASKTLAVHGPALRQPGSWVEFKGEMTERGNSRILGALAPERVKIYGEARHIAINAPEALPFPKLTSLMSQKKSFPHPSVQIVCLGHTFQ